MGIVVLPPQFLARPLSPKLHLTVAPSAVAAAVLVPRSTPCLRVWGGGLPARALRASTSRSAAGIAAGARCDPESSATRERLGAAWHGMACGQIGGMDGWAGLARLRHTSVHRSFGLPGNVAHNICALIGHVPASRTGRLPFAEGTFARECVDRGSCDRAALFAARLGF